MNIFAAKYQPYHGNNRIHIPKQGPGERERGCLQDEETGMREDHHRGQHAGEAASRMAKDALTSAEERHYCDNQAQPCAERNQGAGSIPGSLPAT